MTIANLVAPQIMINLRARLDGLKAAASPRQLPAPYPSFAVVLSHSDGATRAKCFTGTGQDFDAAWQMAEEALLKDVGARSPKLRHLRLDWVDRVEKLDWADYRARMKEVRPNFTRRGLALKADFSELFLEQELNANAMLCLGNGEITAGLNVNNFTNYARRKYGEEIALDFSDEAEIYLLDMGGVYADESGAFHPLYTSGRHAGRRRVDALTPDVLGPIIDASAKFLAREVDADGKFVYGYYPCFDREIRFYNVLRHASTTYSMLEAWELTRDATLLAAIERALDYIVHTIMKPVGEDMAFLVDLGEQVKLGANAVAILAMAKYAALLDSTRYHGAMEKLANGILHMQAPDGTFTHVLNWPDLSLRDQFRIIYYDGEAAFALIRLYSLTKDEKLLKAVEKAFEQFIAKDYWNYRDHWLSYCTNELTLYRPEAKYFEFGIKNFSNHLDYVLKRITTAPTLLELMMAGRKMIDRLKALPGNEALLATFDEDKFDHALHFRANYMLNGHFWPEYAMFFRNPDRIEGSFFMRDCAFRVRIDDNEHYLSGLVNYLTYYHGAASYAPKAEKTQAAEPFNPDSVLILRPPLRPKGQQVIETLAEKAAAKGLTVYYASHRNNAPAAGHLVGYRYDAGAWVPAVFTAPPIIDNSPSQDAAHRALLQRFEADRFVTCHRIGAKSVTLARLEADEASSRHLIAWAELSETSLEAALARQSRVIVKPMGGNRGQNVFMIERLDGVTTLVDDASRRALSPQDLAQFIAARADQGWMVQDYIASQDAGGAAFDLRVPLFRGADLEWQVADIYARIGAGSVTSNLSTGGQVLDGRAFLSGLYGAAEGRRLIDDIRNAALAMAQTLQPHYPFLLDALGFDFGFAAGKAYLFEVNAYPGMKGCPQSGAEIKASYFKHLTELAQQRPGLKNQRLEIESAPHSAASVVAETAQNQRILSQIVAAGPNRFEPAPPSRQSNPVYGMIQQAAAEQGFTATVVSNLHIEIRDAERIIATFSPNSPNLSLAQGMATADKAVTKKLLSAAGLPVPSGSVFTDYDKALAYFQRGKRAMVVKPVDGSGGKGVSTQIRSDEAFKLAWERAARRGGRVIVEDEATGDEMRLIVIGGKIEAAVCRMPAHVIGDGKSTIADLVKAKNQLRLQNPMMRLYPIRQFDHLTEVLRKSLDDIPPKGSLVRLGSVSNLAQGGEAVSVLEALHPSFAELARQAFDAVPGATQLGLDVIARDFSADAFAQNAVIIEMNSDPAIGTPRYPAYGAPASEIAAKAVAHAAATSPAEPPLGAPIHGLTPAPIFVGDESERPYPRSYGLQMRLLRDAARAAGAEVIALSGSHTLIAKDGKRHLFWQGMSDQTLRSARQQSNNKERTKALLRDHGLATPEGRIFAPDQRDAALAFALGLGGKIVVKPLSGSGGRGVSTDVAGAEAFAHAWHEAAGPKVSSIIVERQIIGRDHRLFVVKDQLIAAAERIPVHVIGDGQRAIGQLVAAKNELRRANPHHGSKPIALSEPMLRRLAAMGLTERSVPAKDTTIFLHSVANIGIGGESVDVTDHVHPAWADIAVRARRAIFGAYHIGLDLIAQDIAKSPADQEWSIIEINTNPDFGANHFPMAGAGRDVARVLIDTLFGDGAI